MAKQANDDVLAAAKAQAIDALLSDSQQAEEFAAFTATAKPEQNVVGIGIGPKFKKGKRTSVVSIHIYVEKKVPLEAIPRRDRLPSQFRKVPTDVIETGRLFAQVPIAQRRLRPAKGGCSVGFEGDGFVMAGTFGCLVTDGTRRYILSNNHVLANENALPVGSSIFQPGELDGGVVPGDRIGRLSKFKRIRKLPASNRIDAAIAALDASNLAVPRILPSVGKLGSTATVPAAVGMKVHKHGRTTGYTRGSIIDVSADVNIAYDFGTARFVDQILIVGDSGSFSDAGDSGSLIVARTGNRATGLLFAGSASHTIANKIEEVLTALKVTIVA